MKLLILGLLANVLFAAEYEIIKEKCAKAADSETVCIGVTDYTDGTGSIEIRTMYRQCRFVSKGVKSKKLNEVYVKLTPNKELQINSDDVGVSFIVELGINTAEALDVSTDDNKIKVAITRKEGNSILVNEIVFVEFK